MTVLRQATVPTRPQRCAAGEMTQAAISDAGALTQFGAYVETLSPGARTSERHWHEREDEFLYILSGEATVVENDGPHLIRSGDACCWPAGVDNAHTVEDRSDAPVTFLIVGTRPDNDRCHYPDVGRTQIDEGSTWRVVDNATGATLRRGTRT